MELHLRNKIAYDKHGCMIQCDEGILIICNDPDNSAIFTDNKNTYYGTYKLADENKVIFECELEGIKCQT